MRILVDCEESGVVRDEFIASIENGPRQARREAVTTTDTEGPRGVRRYTEQEIADAYTKFRMAIKGNTVPDTILFVRAEHYEGMQTLLSGSSWDLQREHDLRVTMQGRAETAESALKEAFELLLFAQSEAGPIGPYVTADEEKFSRQRWTDIDSFLRRHFAASAKPKEPKQ